MAITRFLAAIALPVLLPCALILLPCKCFASRSIIVEITLNGEDKGEFFVFTAAGGDFMVKVSDLEAMGFQRPQGIITELENEKYVSLKSMQGVKFHFDENTLALDITAEPSLLKKQLKDFIPGRHKNVVYPANSSFFLNYALDYTSGNNFTASGTTLGNELGARAGNFLFLTDTTYSIAPYADRLTRLQSSIIHDDRKTLQRFTAGDFFASSGELGSSLNMGGLSLSKQYSIDPYLIKQPMLDLTAMLLTRSDVTVYIDGVQMGKETFAPGLAELKDINGAGGLHQVDILIKDSFGRERWIHLPFYFTDTLLRQGFHEYSYNVGYLRNEYGTESNSYSTPVFSAFHRYGVTDSFTAGARAEGGGGVYNLGGEGTYRLGAYGTVFLALSGSIFNGAPGAASSFRYEFQKASLSWALGLKAFSPDYGIISYAVSPNLLRPEYTASAVAGYGVEKLGNLSANYSISAQYGGGRSRVFSVSFQRGLAGKLTLAATYKNTVGQPNDNEVVFNLTYYFGNASNVSAVLDTGRTAGSEGLQIQKNAPLGVGYGYSAVLQRNTVGGQSNYLVNPSVQVNLPDVTLNGTYIDDYSRGSNSSLVDLRAAGSLAYVGGTFGLARPITDSFGLVKVGDINGVDVTVNNQDLGKTDKKGEVFVPSLSSYTDNDISIAQKDIPLNYTLSEANQYVSPALRAGALINFHAKRFTAITGNIKVKYQGLVRPVEYEDITMNVNGKQTNFPTGTGGEFYVENVSPGSYPASFEYLKKQCSFEIIVPESKEMITDLGNIVCKDLR